MGPEPGGAPRHPGTPPPLEPGGGLPRTRPDPDPRRQPPRHRSAPGVPAEAPSARTPRPNHRHPDPLPHRNLLLSLSREDDLSLEWVAAKAARSASHLFPDTFGELSEWPSRPVRHRQSAECDLDAQIRLDSHPTIGLLAIRPHAGREFVGSEGYRALADAKTAAMRSSSMHVPCSRMRLMAPSRSGTWPSRCPWSSRPSVPRMVILMLRATRRP